jgi:hypothetical protein
MTSKRWRQFRQCSGFSLCCPVHRRPRRRPCPLARWQTCPPGRLQTGSPGVVGADSSRSICYSLKLILFHPRERILIPHNSAIGFEQVICSVENRQLPMGTWPRGRRTGKREFANDINRGCKRKLSGNWWQLTHPNVKLRSGRPME